MTTHVFQSYWLLKIFASERKFPVGKFPIKTKLERKFPVGKFTIRTKLIHEFTISVPVLILPVLRRCCYETEKFRVNLCFETRTQRADSRWQQESYFTSTLIYFSIIYFQIGITFQLNYYQ